MRWKSVVWIILFSLLFALISLSSVSSQEKTLSDAQKEVDEFIKEFFSPTFRVQLNIYAEEEDFIGEAVSYCTRELRSLNDVIVVDEDPDWSLEILLYEPQRVDGNKTGVVIYSVIVLEPFDFESAITLALELEGSVSSEQEARLVLGALAAENACFCQDHFVGSGNLEDLKISCQNIIARFDNAQLEPIRRFRQKAHDKLTKEASELKK